MKRYFFWFVLLLIAILSMVTNFYQELSFILGIVLLIIVLDKMGKGIVLRETIAFLYTFTCLLMPAIGYKFYTSSNSLARLWIKYMPVPESDYFSYALPGVALFSLAILLPFSKRTDIDHGERLKSLITQIKNILKSYRKSGLIIICVGIAVSFSIKYLPDALQFFATLFFFGSFAGLLYLYYTPGLRYKRWVMILFVLFILYNAISGGMFTVVAYMGVTIFSFLLLGKRSSLIKKVSIFLVATFLIIVLQNVKHIYRAQTWSSNFKGNKIELFADLYWKNLVKGDALIEVNAGFPLYVRANQGFNVALVMRRVPAVQQFDNGNRLITVFAAAFVPRFLWPDKPEAGGKFNMKYYAGFEIRTWSTNVGPLGEAYGSFGSTGGIVYMFLLGLFLRWVYIKVMVLADRIPLLLCWLPVIFYQIISSAETDTLAILNSVVKSSLFIFLLYKFLPGWFGKGKAANQKSEIASIQSPQPV